MGPRSFSRFDGSPFFSKSAKKGQECFKNRIMLTFSKDVPTASMTSVKLAVVWVRSSKTSPVSWPASSPITAPTGLSPSAGAGVEAGAGSSAPGSLAGAGVAGAAVVGAGVAGAAVVGSGVTGAAVVDSSVSGVSPVACLNCLKLCAARAVRKFLATILLNFFLASKIFLFSANSYGDKMEKKWKMSCVPRNEWLG